MKNFTIIIFLILLASLFIITCNPSISQNNDNDTKQEAIQYAEGSISFNQSSYNGLMTTATVTLIDTDLTNSQQIVDVTSDSDPIGSTLILSRISSGFYQGTLNFTDKTSDVDKIKIAQGDHITVTYQDANPIAVKASTATFNYFEGVIYFQLINYEGLDTDATIDLIDYDLDSSTVNITVDSTTDTTGITVTLNKVSTGYYQGHVGFHKATSTATQIAVTFYQNTINAKYNDSAPSGIRTASTNWWTYKRYLIYTESFAGYGYPGLRNYTPTGSDYNQVSTYQIYYHNEADSDSYEGTNAWRIQWYNGLEGVCWLQFNSSSRPKDLSEFANGNLKFRIKTYAGSDFDDPWIKMRDNDAAADSAVRLLNISGFSLPCLDYKEVTIPLSRFTTNPDIGPQLKLDRVINVFIIGLTPSAYRVYNIDNIYLELDPR